MMQTIPFMASDSLEALNIKLLADGLCLPIDKVNWAEMFPYSPKVNVYLAHSDTHLFIRWDVEEDAILGRYVEDGTPVYTDSCVEAFLQLVPDNEDVRPYYINFEFNCLGAMRAARRYSRAEVIGVLTAAEMRSIQRLPSLCADVLPLSSAGHWSLLVTIPFGLFAFDWQHSSLRAQFYKCGDQTARPHYLSWQPILTSKPDFHHSAYFGDLRFGLAER